MSTRSRKAKLAKSPKSERERLVQKYNKLEQDIVTYENNIGFFAMSKNSEPLIKQMQDRIAQAKEELKTLEAQIRTLDETEAEN
jgi:phage shock protein A